MRNYAKLCETIRNYAKLCETMRNYAKLCQTMPSYENWRIESSLPELARCARGNGSQSAAQTPPSHTRRGLGLREFHKLPQIILLVLLYCNVIRFSAYYIIILLDY